MIVPPVPPARHRQFQRPPFPSSTPSSPPSSRKGGRPRGALGARGQCRALTLRLPPSLLEAVKHVADAGRVPQSVVLQYLITFALTEHGWIEPQAVE